MAKALAKMSQGLILLRVLAFAAMALAFISLPSRAELTPSEVDSDIDAVKELLDAEHVTEAVDWAHRIFKQRDSRNHRFLAEQFGGLFLMNHNFENAITYYELALKDPSSKMDVYSPFARYGYERIANLARAKGLEQLSSEAGNRAAAVKSFESRWRAGTVSDVEASAWLKPLRESTDLRLQSAYCSDLAKLRLTQKRNAEAVELAERAFDLERKYFTDRTPSPESARRLVDECWYLGDLMMKGGGRKKSVPVFQQGHRLAKRYQVLETEALLSDPHRFRVAIAEAEGVSCEDAFNSRFNSALDELTLYGPYDYIKLARASDLYVESIHEEAAYFANRNRLDLAVKVYEREIPIMLSRIPETDPYRGTVFANYHRLVKTAQIPDPSNKSVPVCNTCRINLNVVPDYPQVIRFGKHNWRCRSCNGTF